MDLTQKKILLTGGGGFLGSAIHKKLLEIGVPEANITIPRSKDVDLRVRENCIEVMKGQQVVIHAAATVGGIGANKEHPGQFFYDNAIMGIQLIEEARKAGVEKFVTIGTVCAYPKFTPVPFKEDDLWNGYPDKSNAPYGLAKKMLLVQSQAYRQEYGFNAIYLILENLYGPGDNFDPKVSHVIPALIRKVGEAQKAGATFIEPWGTGTPTREFLYVDDAAAGIVAAAANYDKPEPVNLGSGNEITIKNLVETICKHMSFTGEIRFDATKPDGQPRRGFDITRAKGEFGFNPTMSFDEGLKKTIEWYRANST